MDFGNSHTVTVHNMLEDISNGAYDAGTVLFKRPALTVLNSFLTPSRFQYAPHGHHCHLHP
jgi:hypothetical protein